MIFDAWDNYTKDVNNIILDIQNNLTKQIKQKEYKTEDIVYSNLSNGNIKYKNGYFTGTFTKKLLNTLISAGGVKSIRGVKFDIDKMPKTIQKSIKLFEDRKENKTKNILSQLKKVNVDNLINVSLLTILTTNIYKRLVKNFNKEKLTTKSNFSSSLIFSLFYQKLLTELQNNIKYIIDNFITKQELSITGLDNRLKNMINSSSKNVLLNTINQTLFETQEEQAKENDIEGFYWWHRPTKRPSDRQYHRKHYEESLKGKKFYWNNLPVYQGERDYPSKLWHCHCRAFIRKKEFLDAKE